MDAAPDRATIPMVAVSNPGGAARHFRVQYQPCWSTPWRLYGVFRSLHDAENAILQLSASGYPARIVAYAIPAAA